MIDVKIVFTGPNGAGKTSLLFALTGQTYAEYLPSVFPPSGQYDTSYTTTATDGTQVRVHLWDTYVQEEYDRLRPLSFPGSDLFVLCVPAVNGYVRSSEPLKDTVEKFWRNEICRCGFSDVPVILLILKKDLVSPDNVEYQISPENRDEAIQEMGAWGWRSISSQDNNDIQDIKETMAEVALRHRRPRKKKKSCILL